MKMHWIIAILLVVMISSPAFSQTSITDTERILPDQQSLPETSLEEPAAEPAPVIPIRHLWGDCDNDGLPDIFKLDGNGNRMFRNLGDGSFEDITLMAFPGGAKMGLDGIWGDVDRDGLSDLYLFHKEGFTLFSNQGGTLFIDVTQKMGLNPSILALSAKLEDYDGDGFEDLLVKTSTGDCIFRNQEGLGFNEVMLPGQTPEPETTPVWVKMATPGGDEAGMDMITDGFGSDSGKKSKMTANLRHLMAPDYSWMSYLMGDITAVYADNGLTGGATSGDAHLNVGAGDGIDVGANSVAVDVTDVIGSGLTESSNNIMVDFAGTGAASTVARSDHSHTVTSTAVVYENALDDGTSTTVLECDDADDGILIRFGNESDENGVVFGQYANGNFSGIKIDNLGALSVFHMNSTGSILDTGDYRLVYDESVWPYKLVLYHDGTSDWCDYMYIKRSD